MGLPVYLAMTDWEIAGCDRLPEHPAYMACHFSPYGSGIDPLPENLPPGCLLVLDDRIPVWAHEPKEVARQLKEAVTACSATAVLLDFQNPGCDRAKAIVQAVTESLPCPVGVTAAYANGFSCPVLIPPPAPNRDLKDCLTPWKGREIWLELALDGLQVTVTKDGSRFQPLPRCTPEGTCHRDEALCCSYQIKVGSTQAVFTLFRTPEDLRQLLSIAAELGVTRAIGLYQELCDLF